MFRTSEMATGAFASDPLRKGCSGTGSGELKDTTPINSRFDGGKISQPTNQGDSNTFAGHTASKPAFIGEG